MKRHGGLLDGVRASAKLARDLHTVVEPIILRKNKSRLTVQKLFLLARMVFPPSLIKHTSH
jgi:hypothetical protein